MLNPDGFTIAEFAAFHGLPYTGTEAEKRAITARLRALGYSVRVTKRHGRSTRVWSKPASRPLMSALNSIKE